MNLSQGTHLDSGPRQEMLMLRNSYITEALKAFKIFDCKLGRFYTCNVERFRQCDRLGEEKQVSLWKSHFFLQSNAFQCVKGVIFNARPGTELAEYSLKQVDKIYLVLTGSSCEILDPSDGEKIYLDKEVVFASTED